MRRLLKAEFNSVYRKPKFYIFLIILVVLFGFGFFLEKVANFGTAMTFVDFIYPLLAILIIVDISHKEYKYHTMKNLIGAGFSRQGIYFGKLIVSVVVAIAFIAFHRLLDFLSALIDGKSYSFSMEDFQEIVRLIGMYAIIFIICMLIVSDGISLLIAVLYGILAKYIIMMLGMFQVVNERVSTKLNMIFLLTDDPTYAEINFKTGDVVTKTVEYPYIWWGIGVVVAIAALVAGLVMFKRKEFK